MYHLFLQRKRMFSLSFAVCGPIQIRLKNGSLSVEKEVLNKRVRTGGLPPGYIDQ
jgi:hypothetical protein